MRRLRVTFVLSGSLAMFENNLRSIERACSSAPTCCTSLSMFWACKVNYYRGMSVNVFISNRRRTVSVNKQDEHRERGFVAK